MWKELPSPHEVTCTYFLIAAKIIKNVDILEPQNRTLHHGLHGLKPTSLCRGYPSGGGRGGRRWVQKALQLPPTLAGSRALTGTELPPALCVPPTPLPSQLAARDPESPASRARHWYWVLRTFRQDLISDVCSYGHFGLSAMPSRSLLKSAMS